MFTARCSRRYRSPSLLLLLLVTVLFPFAAPAAPPVPESVPTEMEIRIGGMHGERILQFRDGRLTCEATGRDAMATVQLPRPSSSAWAEFRSSLDRLDVWRWQHRYANPRIEDGMWWSVRIRYADAAMESSGSNAYPDARGKPGDSAAVFNQLRSALATLSKRCPL